MEQFNQLLQILADFYLKLGVPDAYSTLVALASLYLGAILLVALFIGLILRLGRSRQVTPKTEIPAGVNTSDVAGGSEPLAEEPAPDADASVVVDETPEGGEVPVTIPVESESAGPEVVEGQPDALMVAIPEEPVPAEGLFARLKRGLSRTQESLVGRLDDLLRGRKEVDADLLEDIEEILITADVGMETTRALIKALEGRLARKELQQADMVRQALKEELASLISRDHAPFDLNGASPCVLMVVGVNGVGKTTTIGKLAKRMADEGKRVVLGAGDTFRAAAADQLEIWGERAGVDVIRHKEGADPGAVAFDAAKAAVARKADVLILDTAGRLHNKNNLMEELRKIRKILNREIPGAPHQTLLVLDATTGQNALIQAKTFHEVVELDGLVLTKLDGTAKGGVVAAIAKEMALPIRFIGVGEKVEDLRPFDAGEFVDALFATPES